MLHILISKENNFHQLSGVKPNNNLNDKYVEDIIEYTTIVV